MRSELCQRSLKGRIKLKVAIFGANGYLGRALSMYLNHNDVETISFSHSKENSSTSTTQQFTLDNPQLPQEADFTHLIYLSWSTQRDEKSQKNSSLAAKKVAQWAGAHEVSPIFISSMAAYPNAPRSNYGKEKRKAEGYFLQENGKVIRPGTIHALNGDGGSATSGLSKVMRIGKYPLQLLQPIRFPAIGELEILQVIYGSLNDTEGVKNQILNSYSRIDTIQGLYKIKAGFIPIKFLHSLSIIFPAKIKDRIATLLDLSELDLSN